MAHRPPGAAEHALPRGPLPQPPPLTGHENSRKTGTAPASAGRNDRSNDRPLPALATQSNRRDLESHEPLLRLKDRSESGSDYSGDTRNSALFGHKCPKRSREGPSTSTDR